MPASCRTGPIPQSRAAPSAREQSAGDADPARILTNSCVERVDAHASTRASTSALRSHSGGPSRSVNRRPGPFGTVDGSEQRGGPHRGWCAKIEPWSLGAAGWQRYVVLASGPWGGRRPSVGLTSRCAPPDGAPPTPVSARRPFVLATAAWRPQPSEAPRLRRVASGST
jgi:hypothetical protein